SRQGARGLLATRSKDRNSFASEHREQHVKDALQQADEIPVTLLVAIGYVTMAFLTSPTAPSHEQLHQHGSLMATWSAMANRGDSSAAHSYTAAGCTSRSTPTRC